MVLLNKSYHVRHVSATAFVLEIVETVYRDLEIRTYWCKNCILYYLWQVFFLYAEKWSGHGLNSRCGSYAYEF